MHIKIKCYDLVTMDPSKDYNKLRCNVKIRIQVWFW